MPHVDQMLMSKYLSKGDVAAGIVAHIRGVALDQGGRNNEDPKWVMYFNEVRKPMQLNNTVLRYLAECLGPNSDGWIGKKVKIYVDHSVMMAGQAVGGIRLKVAASAMAQRAQVINEFHEGMGGKHPGGSGGPVFAGNATPNRPTAGAASSPPQRPQTQSTDADFGAVDAATGEIGHPADPDFDDEIPF